MQRYFMVASPLFRPLFYPFGFLLAVLLTAAALAPWIHHISHGSINLATALGRGAMLGLVLAFVPLARRWRLDLPSLGLPHLRRLPLQILTGLLAGLVTMGLHAALLNHLQIRLIIPGTTAPEALAHRLMGNIALGLTIGTVEELLFRGMLYAAIRRFHGDAMAILVSTLYFTLPHFLSTKLQIPEDSIQWDSGFILLGSAGQHLLTAADISSVAALLAAGLVLGCIRYRFPDALGYCIGMHAGWVAILKTYHPVSVFVPEIFSRLYWTVGEYDHVIGWLSTLWSLPLAAAIAWMARKRSSSV